MRLALGLVASLLLGCGGSQGPAQLESDWPMVLFDTVKGRATSAPVDVVVTNSGGQTAKAVGVDLHGDLDSFTIEHDGCSSVDLAPRAQCTVQLSLRGDISGSFDGVLRVWSFVGAGVEVPLHGKVAPPALAITPPTASQIIGPAGVAQFALTVSNVGGGSTDPITVSGPSAFTLSDNCTGRSLGPGEQCSVAATYRAPATELPPPIIGQITASAGSDSVTATLTAQVSLATGLQVSDLDFGLVPDETTPSRTLTVGNPTPFGTQPLTVQLINDPANPYAAFSLTEDGCSGKTLAPGESCLLQIAMNQVYNDSAFRASVTVTTGNVPPGTGHVTAMGQRAHFEVHLVFAGSGGGNIVLDGFSAQPTISETWWVDHNGNKATLQAVASPGSVFAGWTGACAGSPATCVLTPADNADLATTATFNRAP